MTTDRSEEIRLIPVLPLKNVIALPRTIMPVVVGRDLSIRAVEFALKETREVFITAQKDANVEVPGPEDVYRYGTRASIIQVGRMQNNTLKILIEGIYRSVAKEFIDTEGFMCARVMDVKSKHLRSHVEEKALIRNIYNVFKEFVDLNDGLSRDILGIFNDVAEDVSYIIDTLAVHLKNIDVAERQKLLELSSVKQRAIKMIGFLQEEVEILKAEQKIRERVQNQLEKHQKDYYLNEQIRAIQRELGKDDYQQEINNLREKARQAGLPTEAMEKVEAECRRLEQMQPTSPEAGVSRSYVEWLVSLPWSKVTKDTVSLEKARKILDHSHARMKKPKERILEFLAAKKFAKNKLKKSPIICLAGPPGVGKTSLASSISEALGRKMIRISLGGVRDEAEIRGHRRTYIGALPGKIIQAMKRAGVINPVIVLDEVDKMAMDFRGDPSSALLEVLDPEQNKSFVDHYLEIEYDLSQVMFVTTANVIDAIPYPLLDRMEIIQLSGYTIEEKEMIARSFLLPKLLKEHALSANAIRLGNEELRLVIESYTKEAGVRQLSQVLAKVLRKSIQQLLDNPSKKRVVVTKELLSAWLGVEKYKIHEKKHEALVGVVTGLAWTELGGEILEIETCLYKGKGGLTLTGQLGEVMQESAQAALSYIRSRQKELNIPARSFSEYDVHLHLPEGAIPKDGPSAGIAIATALASAFTNRAVKPRIAMSGEITLRGRVLAVGGLKDKLLAATRYGMEHVLVPKENQRDIESFKDELDKNLTIVYVEHVDEVLAYVLEKKPVKERKSPLVNSKKKPTLKEKTAGIVPAL